MYRMDKRIIKKRLLEQCLELVQKKIGHLEMAMAEAESSANEYGPQSDIYDSQIMQIIGDRDMYAGQLKTEMDMLETLYKIDVNTTHDEVEFGSIVETESQKIFIAIGLGKLTIENTVYYAISTKVPFYLAMKGRRKGDAFEFRGNKFTILDIY